MNTAAPIRVLIVDDSATVRKTLSAALSSSPDIVVVGTAPDPYIAREKVIALQPDVITLDIEMPRMDGLTFLKKLMEYKPIPVIMISSLGQASCQASLEALRLGAVEVLAKPNGPYSVGDLTNSLCDKVRAAARANLRATRFVQPQRPESAGIPVRASSMAVSPGLSLQARSRVIAIGASTGGPQTLTRLLQSFPAEMPPIVITQHMPPVFTTHLAERLNKMCSIEVREAVDGDELRAGLALIAPGDFHMAVQPSGNSLWVRVSGGPQVCYSRPSVDVLFASVARSVGRRAIGVILTGMGADGARGMLQMREAGAATIAQDEETSIVFGMPKEAIRIGAVQMVSSLDNIAAAVMNELQAGGSAPRQTLAHV